MLIFILVVAFFFTLRAPATAQIPLFYQLLQAYHPGTVSYFSPISASDNILGVTTSAISPPTPTPTVSIPPANIGSGDPPIIVAVLGDSMIDTLGADIPQLQSALSQYFPNRQFKILNYGYGGSQIESGLYRLSHDYDYQGTRFPSLLSQRPDIIVVESFAYNNFGNSQSGIDRQWLNLGAITSTISNSLPQTKIVLAAAISPNSVVFGNGIKDTHFTALEKIEKSNTIKLYLQNLVNFATSQGFPLADAYHLSLDQLGQGRPELISATDHLHPSAAGGQLIADTIAKTIFDKQLLD